MRGLYRTLSRFTGRLYARSVAKGGMVGAKLETPDQPVGPGVPDGDHAPQDCVQIVSALEGLPVRENQSVLLTEFAIQPSLPHQLCASRDNAESYLSNGHQKQTFRSRTGSTSLYRVSSIWFGVLSSFRRWCYLYFPAYPFPAVRIALPCSVLRIAGRVMRACRQPGQNPVFFRGIVL
mgnify:CR=1 FL=1